MYRKLLAPLDGSDLSECSLEHVKAIASGCQVPEVVLLRVTEPISTKAFAAYPEMVMINGNLLVQMEEQEKTSAKEYVERMAIKLKKEGVQASAAIAFGRPAEEILNYAEKNQVDLIIMSTHGRSGISRFAYGSVAERVSRNSPVPVLIVSPPGCRTEGIKEK